jgi:rhamnosyltransferase
MNSIKIAAIFTTYKPDCHFRKRINSVVQSCYRTIVVDNTPGGHAFSEMDLVDISLFQDGINKGLGSALNIGIQEAQRQGCDAVVLFDQDSSPNEEFIKSLIDTLSDVGPRTIIGPLLIDDQKQKEINLDNSSKHCSEFEEVTCIATSGMCFRLDGVDSDDGFTEDFFLDFVDFEWCWRMRHKGWRILRLTYLPMLHRLGLAQRKFLGLTYHVPAPYRHYFQFRDALKLLNIHYVPIYSRIRLTVILLPKLFVYPWLLDRGIERLSWMIKGIVDAFLGKKGIGSAFQKLN